MGKVSRLPPCFSDDINNLVQRMLEIDVMPPQPRDVLHPESTCGADPACLGPGQAGHRGLRVLGTCSPPNDQTWKR